MGEGRNIEDGVENEGIGMMEGERRGELTKRGASDGDGTKSARTT